MLKLYRYWAAVDKLVKDAKGNSLLVKKWGGSNESVDEAKNIAEQALKALVDKVAQINIRKASSYDYINRDIPEEVLGEISPSGGVTRNNMGCKV